MNPTEDLNPETFFVEILQPLNRANKRSNIRYLERARDRESYWGPVVTRTGGMEKLTAGSASAEAMLEALSRHWQGEMDANLTKLAPLLAGLRLSIVAPKNADSGESQLPEFVYPLF